MHLLFVFVLLSYASISEQALVGGETNVDANDPEYLTISWRAVKQLNNENSADSQFYYVPIKVKSASVQVVAGSLTKLAVYYGESTCSKSKVEPQHVYSTNCQVSTGGKRALYEIEDYQRPWENFEEFTIKKTRDVPAGEKI